jgi:hypothetical protein
MLRARVTMVTGDGPAVAEVMGLKRPGNAYRPCRYCTIKGHGHGTGGDRGGDDGGGGANHDGSVFLIRGHGGSVDGYHNREFYN